MRKREQLRLTPRLLTPVADWGGHPSLSRLGEKSSRLGVGREGGFRCGCAEFGMPVATSGEDVQQAFGVEFGELTRVSSASR